MDPKPSSFSPKPDPADLLVAVREDDVDAVKRLLQQGADINATDDTGNTPLINAARYGHLAIVRVLLDNGAKVDERNKLGTSALMMTIYQTYSPAQAMIVRLLLEKGANMDFKNLKGETALDIATSLSRLTVTSILKQEAIRRQGLAEQFALAAEAKRREELAEKRRALNERAKKTPRPVIVPKEPKA